MNNIYKATSNNINDIFELERTCFSSPLSEHELNLLLKSEFFEILVFESDGNFCGHCVAYTVLGETEITSFAISPLYRRKNYGFLFLTKVIDILKKRKVNIIFLEVRVSNVYALNLYKKIGFRIDRVRRGFYEKPQEDAYAMSMQMTMLT